MVIIAAKPGIRVQAHFKAGSLARISLFSSKNLSLDCPLQDQSGPLIAWLQAYSQGQYLAFPLPLAQDTFQGAVLRFLQTIPWGSVCSYQDVAKGVGSPRAARAVGNICRGNLFPLLIPCHRVIRSNGEIGRYTPDPSLKRQLLYFEGVSLSK
jgi:O-6-methylguanine DNA methyltransferase